MRWGRRSQGVAEKSGVLLSQDRRQTKFALETAVHLHLPANPVGDPVLVDASPVAESQLQHLIAMLIGRAWSEYLDDELWGA